MPDKLPSGPYSIEMGSPFSERTLKYGRNVMALGGVILVLAYVPHIEICKFKPFGFEINEGGEISVWGILAAVLCYYALQFYATGWIDFLEWSHSNSPLFAKGVDIAQLHRWRQRMKVFFRFFILDFAVPTTLFGAALWASAAEICRLLNVQNHIPCLNI